MNVVNSRLLFIDSESVRGTGKEFEVFLDTTKVRTYKDNQLLGISLQSFSGYRNFPHVNTTNAEFVVRISNQVAGDFQAGDVFTRELTHGDYPNIKVLSATVMEKLQSALDAYTVANGYANAVLQNDTVSDLDLTQRLSHQLVVTGQIPNQILRIQVLFPKRSLVTNGILDSHHLLGGRVYTGDSLHSESATPGLDISIADDGVSLTVKSFYRIHTSTTSHVFIRTDLMNNNLASYGHEQYLANDTHDPHTHTTNILGRATVHDDFVYLEEGSHGVVYTAVVPNPKLNSIRFSITDHHGKLLPSADRYQADIGNLQFHMVLKIDVIEYTS
jgi:hypothetical protein